MVYRSLTRCVDVRSPVGWFASPVQMDFFQIHKFILADDTFILFLSLLSAMRDIM